MNRLFVIMTVVFGTLISGPGFAQEIDWSHNLEAAKAEANQQDKLVLIHFSADWCRPCKQLETFVFSSPMVSKAISEKLIPVHINTDDHPELVKEFAIKEIPSDVIITSKGRVVSKRKSPKDVSNYVRMVKSLPAANTANELQNVEIAQKIDQVLTASVDTSKTTNPNERDFVVAKPNHQQPAPSMDSLKLRAKSASARQVDHESNGLVVASGATNTQQINTPVLPQRVINDKFFVEKSVEKTSANRQTSQVASAIIENPFQGSEQASAEKKNTAARIMPPEFGKDREMSVAHAEQNTDEARQAPGRVKSDTQAVDKKTVKTNRKVPVASGKTATEKSRASLAESVAPEFALGGRCPVTLLKDGKWAKGDSRFGCIHRGRIYIFADEAKLKLFKTAPDQYSPVLAGYDPVAFHESGDLVNGKAQHGVFMGKSPEQKIVLFASKETRDKFQASPQKYMSTIRTAVKRTSEQRKLR